MHKSIFANRFGLIISIVHISLLPSTAAWAQKTPINNAGSGTQQVIVTNNAAQPVPVTMAQPGSQVPGGLS
jgi:hypothetical protein